MNKPKLRFASGIVSVLALALAFGLTNWLVPEQGLGTATAQSPGSVNVYSARQEALIRPLLDAFTEATGISVNLITASADALLERMKAEGRNSPADVLLTTDAGRLIRATEADVLRPVTSDLLAAAIPEQYRDPDGYWFGLGVRARVFFYAPDRVDPTDLSTYENLAAAEWQGRVCIRSSTNVYNQSLLASLIAHDGAVGAENWAAGMVANMARDPQGGDRDQIKAVAAGQCDVAVANTYYYAGMKDGTAEEQQAAAQVALFWPNQGAGERGTHVNISGAGVGQFAPNPENAVRLLEFLVSPDAQKIYAEVVYEFPVRSGVPASDAVASFGTFQADTLDLHRLAEFQSDALMMFDRVGWR
ncbi:MAG: Fe(3+) ABC transporter substrate-binding protein [Alphaproteobacteria bacterium]|jgi:iron(III) transport system substrate-binding protein|nr:Fe(3+) ABC transporter substrate-binding protein [Alphaproteobacteria bacterium]MBT5861020.1 Fe(3+) ABC transporter substrate-binding protein [Alphaproteobacteria bacterium]